jgi:hypothetical protein
MCDRPGNASSGSCGTATCPAGTATAPCPLCDQVKIEQLVEEVTYNASQHRQNPSARNQYVNLDPSASGGPHHDHGRVIYLRAKLKWKAGDRSRSLAGKRVYWKAEPHGSNKAGLTAAIAHGFDSAGSGTVTKQTTVDASGWTPVVRFYLSLYGNDKYTIRATEETAYTGGKMTGQFTVWRKLWYEADCMARSGGGSYANRFNRAGLEQAYRDQFVELVQTGADSAPAHQRIMTSTEVGAWASGIRTGTGSPRYFHLVFLDTIAVNPQTVTVTRTITPGNTIDLPARTYALDSRNWLVGASYRQPAGTGTWNALTAAQVGALGEAGSPSSNDDRFTVTPSFPASVNAANPVEVRLQLRNFSALSGLQTGMAVIVGVRWRERFHRNNATNLSNSTLNTAIHEPAHFMGLAANRLPTGGNNTSYYFQNGGHCNNNSNRCVMYHANSTSTSLCNTCCDCLRGRNLSNLPISGTAAYTG